MAGVALKMELSGRRATCILAAITRAKEKT
jgi:hypothetical protein